MFARICVVCASLLLVVGCVDDITGPVDAPDDGYEYELGVSPGGLVTLDEMTLTLHVSDDHGGAMTGFNGVQLQYRAVDTAEWSTIPMNRSGAGYEAHHTFNSSGEFEFRAMRNQESDHGDDDHGDDDHGDDDHGPTVMMHEFHDPVHVSRAHRTADDHRVEFESFPGHVSQGSEVAFRFWVTEGEEHSTEPEPATGLSPSIECVESTGMVHRFDAVETSPGVYEATHIVEQPGDTEIRFEFAGQASNPVATSFRIQVEAEHQD